MGAFDMGQYVQLKKAQGETNDRLDELLIEVRRTNQLLAWVCEFLHKQADPDIEGTP